MTTDEFDRFWDWQSDEYVESLRASLPPDAASAKAQDDRRLGLNVFGHNRAAIALYESAGYAVTAQQMAKPLGGP